MLGRDNQRRYCREVCLTRGEERAQHYVDAIRATGMISSPWYVGLAAILAVAMMAFTFTGGTRAWAHDPLTHQVNDLANARSKHAGLCCNGEDYTLISSWERTATGYRIHFGGQWVPLPKEAEVNNMPNPDGEAKAWVVFDELGAPFVRCFMRGMEG
jgi:hypothetical protein